MQSSREIDGIDRTANWQEAEQRRRRVRPVFCRFLSVVRASEKELHDIIRAFTIHAMRPVNQSLLEWLRDDSFFKAQSGDTPLGKLAGELARLEVHLILWLAKYEVWIPEFKAHALVYLVDEKGHGVGFPVGIDELIPPARTVLESAFLGRMERISDRLGA